MHNLLYIVGIILLLVSVFVLEGDDLFSGNRMMGMVAGVASLGLGFYMDKSHSMQKMSDQGLADAQIADTIEGNGPDLDLDFDR